MSLTKRIALFSHCHLRIGVRPLERTNDAKSRMTKYGSMSRDKKKVNKKTIPCVSTISYKTQYDKNKSLKENARS